MVFSPLSNELFGQGICGFLSTYKDKEVKRTVKLDTEGSVVHESLAISYKETGKKMFTVDLFQTTSKVTVNGSQLKLFLEEYLDCILDKINQNGSLDVINSQIKEVCQRYLMKNASKSFTKSATRRSLDSSETSSHRNTVISPQKN